MMSNPEVIGVSPFLDSGLTLGLPLQDGYNGSDPVLALKIAFGGLADSFLDEIHHVRNFTILRPPGFKKQVFL